MRAARRTLGLRPCHIGSANRMESMVIGLTHDVIGPEVSLDAWKQAGGEELPADALGQRQCTQH